MSRRHSATTQMATGRGPTECVVAIPVKDEAERLPGCLNALANQNSLSPPAIVVLVNNSRDESAAIAQQFAAQSCLDVHVHVRTLAKASAHAGTARRLAMEFAVDIVAAGGVLLTSDADSVVPTNWISANLTALRDADAVAGRAVISSAEARLIPDRLHVDDARECAYAALLDEVCSILDPDPNDPWPRHSEESGASIAVRAATYRLVGGMPAVALGEDRVFFNALRAVDARIRHAPEIAVTVSGRITGRARGGMADTIRRRMDRADEWLDDRLETLDDAVFRARLRRKVRQGIDIENLAQDMRLPGGVVAAALDEHAFGAGWAVIERLSPALSRRPVRANRLEVETRRAHALLTTLRQSHGRPKPTAPHQVEQECGDDKLPGRVDESQPCVFSQLRHRGLDRTNA